MNLRSTIGSTLKGIAILGIGYGIFYLGQSYGQERMKEAINEMVTNEVSYNKLDLAFDGRHPHFVSFNAGQQHILRTLDTYLDKDSDIILLDVQEPREGRLFNTMMKYQASYVDIERMLELE